MIQQEQQELIEKYVKANPYYEGNEDLLSDFCQEAYNKAYLILNTSNNIQKTENFVSKIVNTTIISVLKQNQRYKKLPPKEYDVDTDVTVTNPQINQVRDLVYDFPDPLDSMEDVVVKRELLQSIVDTVCIIHREVPSKLFYDIFYLRYFKKKTQNEISQELNLPQSEVSKRMLHLAKLISTYLYKK